MKKTALKTSSVLRQIFTGQRIKRYSTNCSSTSDEVTPTPLTAVVKRRPSKHKVVMLLGYCGSGYYGMQYNPPHKTIEGEILTKLFDVGAISEENSLAPKKNSFMAAARTDKGVHAMLNLLSLKITLREDTVAKLNAALPPEIRVWGIQPVNKKFNARSACDSRWYQYLIPEFILIGPPRSSLLHRNVGGCYREDGSQEVWDTFLEQTRGRFSGDELCRLQDTAQKLSESDPLVQDYVGLLSGTLSGYCLPPSKLDAFEAAMQEYVGTHNFHNFTTGKLWGDPSAQRHIKKVVVSQASPGWICVRIHGQSFMLHQIRRMVALAVLAARCQLPPNIVRNYFNAGPRKYIPRAPAQGLLLEGPVFDGYNTKLRNLLYCEIRPDDITLERMCRFRERQICTAIAHEETQRHVFCHFVRQMNRLATPLI
ncbi:ASN_HP2_G0018800.mRNA.1.CDS.1 [Saccharomyces cerevisiae]|nr:Y55_G0032830.mRNA.1.CDS.1 [Saccharomyces cerevisiae]CAI4440807.1 ABH_G0020890.mRNA.1.CDS.1 [Saccharomyces cerevisiae]CAI4457274.1 BGN_3a_G0019320.mRNA.1.CDS.1 [Saccharomyces cerevisiae]CAI4458192.1 CPG_1a_G0019630.mRNA.1.CDS.1 [Saccharomyces cerevisiae]CAI4461230.1 CPI_1c_G0019530.mRNA.1.CDS.1 [Saccharomyces cerevisiae]